MPRRYDYQINSKKRLTETQHVCILQERNAERWKGFLRYFQHSNNTPFKRTIKINNSQRIILSYGSEVWASANGEWKYFIEINARPDGKSNSGPQVPSASQDEHAIPLSELVYLHLAISYPSRLYLSHRSLMNWRVVSAQPQQAS